MTSTEFVKLVEQQFGYEPTAEQHGALERFAAFMADRSDRSLMILRGSAGTGKTTLAGALIGVLGRLGVKTVLLAPTGRAAKVFSLNSGQSASTIHRKIYRRKSVEGGFSLAFNAHSNTLFLVDEASMISGVGGGLGMFGTNSLLDDLMSFVYEGRHCRLLLIGDPAQLPPVGENEAPALDGEVMRGYGMTVYEADMSEVMRQSQDSGILWNATKIRNFDGFEVGDSLLPTIQFKGFADIRIVRGDELIESLASSYSAVGMDETIVVTRSNKRANAYNTGIRNTILGREEELTTGDLLMVVRNKYLKSGVKELGSEGVKKNEDGVGRSEETELDFIANGDHAVVCRVRNIHEMHGFRFADVLLRFPDYDDAELQSMVLLDTLQSEAPALTAEQSRQLYDRVLADYADVKPKSKRLKQLMEDVYYSALQVKYGYAVTCHKSQGG
ncbi:MAG: AAA family ATPase, partial [Prevotella sp.]|nr:AAA family ATPase [Prevotella sp.]